MSEQIIHLLSQVLSELQAVKTEVVKKVEQDERFEANVDRLEGVEDRLDSIMEMHED
ncbi:hypothetical protein [Cohnella endophytica]|uniref:hypothetical protein n=1 Tax=Cohnella endophytica TaxID=2419778 RepID=UPI00131439D1|nr:hypothetical protein [Cohnella endophytica]